MAQPNVNISRSNGNLNRAATTEDNVFALVLSGAAIADKIALSEPKLLQSVDDLATLGITSENNPLAFAEVTAFYSKATPGTDLYLMLYSDATMLATLCDKDTGAIKTLMNSTDGRLNAIFINKIMPDEYEAVITDGLDADVWAAISKLQALCQYYQTKNQPLYAVLPGFGFTVAAAGTLKNMETMTNNMVSVLLAADNEDGKPAIGALAGWRAKVTVVKGQTPQNAYWQNIGRVADGPFADVAWLVDGTPANDAAAVLIQDDLHDKRFIYLRKFTGKSGYFFNDDPTACSKTDDYSSISWNAVMNKVQRIAYSTLVEKVNDNVPATPLTGGISISLAADWESDVERAINQQMTSKGAISAVKCTVDTESSNLETDEVNALVEVVRNGQAKYINVTTAYTETV